jgi:hypothetical protein
MHKENEKKTDDNHDQRADRIKKMLDLAVMWNYVNGISDVLENKEVCIALFCIVLNSIVWSIHTGD